MWRQNVNRTSDGSNISKSKMYTQKLVKFVLTKTCACIQCQRLCVGLGSYTGWVLLTQLFSVKERQEIPPLLLFCTSTEVSGQDNHLVQHGSPSPHSDYKRKSPFKAFCVFVANEGVIRCPRSCLLSFNEGSKSEGLHSLLNLEDERRWVMVVHVKRGVDDSRADGDGSLLSNGEGVRCWWGPTVEV